VTRHQDSGIKALEICDCFLYLWLVTSGEMETAHDGMEKGVLRDKFNCVL
jgi:hypothetical protein